MDNLDEIRAYIGNLPVDGSSFQVPYQEFPAIAHKVISYCRTLIEMVEEEHRKRVEMRDAHNDNRKKFADMLVTLQSRIDRAVKDFDAAWQTGDYRNVVPWGIINEILGLLTAPLEVEEGTSAPEENPPVGFDDPRLPQSEDDFNAEYDMNEEGDK